MGWESKYFTINLLTKENLRMALDMTVDFSLMKSKTSTMETGNLELFMEKAFSKPANPCILAPLLTGSNTEQEKNIFPMETYTEESIKMADLMEQEHISGMLMPAYTKETLKMGLDMGKVNGLQDRLNTVEDMWKV